MSERVVAGFSDRVECPKCGARRAVVLDTNGAGRLVDVTPPCPCAKRPKRMPAWRTRVNDDRRRAAVCQLCEAPVVGKPKVALYCEAHREEMRARTMRKYAMKVGDKHQVAYRARHREKLAAKSRASYRRSKAERKRRNEYKREWRRKNRDKVKAQKRRHALRGKAAEAARRHKEREAAGLALHTPAPRNERGERLCVGSDCSSVVAGRAKLCADCKQRLAA